MIFSNIEFYYTNPELISSDNIIITGDEAKHLAKVMRHSVNDEIYVTDGMGKVYKSVIKNITKNETIAKIEKVFQQENKLTNTTFCIPILKAADRFEFALEKSVELGITNFLIFNAKKSYKRGIKLDRWERILVSAMKQSLHAYKPKIEFAADIRESVPEQAQTIIFEQTSKISFQDYFINENKNKLLQKGNTFFLFGPEGGLTKEEIDLFNNAKLMSLNENRLRSETAIITAAALLANLFKII